MNIYYITFCNCDALNLVKEFNKIVLEFSISMKIDYKNLFFNYNCELIKSK